MITISNFSQKVCLAGLVVMLLCFPFHAAADTANAELFEAEASARAGGSGTAAYVIGPTNLLEIKVLGQSSLQDTFRVDESGFITHPLLGRIKLAGKTVSDAEMIIQKMLTGDYILNPNVTISVMEHSRFSVLGEVRKPGNYEILGRVSLMEGLSIAGGFTPLANQKKIRILRYDAAGEQTLIINVKDIMNGGQDGHEIDIKPGDVIEIPPRFF